MVRGSLTLTELTSLTPGGTPVILETAFPFGLFAFSSLPNVLGRRSVWMSSAEKLLSESSSADSPASACEVVEAFPATPRSSAFDTAAFAMCIEGEEEPGIFRVPGDVDPASTSWEVAVKEGTVGAPEEVNCVVTKLELAKVLAVPDDSGDDGVFGTGYMKASLDGG